MSETWCAPGTSSRLTPNLCWTREVERNGSVGHYPYGYAILFNPRKAKREDFKVIDIANEDRQRNSVTIEYNGLHFICCYAAPNEHLEFEQMLAKARKTLDSDTPTFLIGDFNARH